MSDTRGQRAAARAEYLKHPDSSIADVVKATGTAPRTVARARKQLVKEGLLAPGRKTMGADRAALTAAARDASNVTGGESDATGGLSAPEAVSGETGQPEKPDTPRGSKPGTTIDGEALRKLDEMLDELANEDDDKTRDRMLRQVKRFAFDPDLHPDTRMSASQLWTKLLDMKRAKDLGPGVPKTLEAAIARCTDFLRACGAKVAVPSFYAAFELGDPNAPQAEQAPVADGPASSPTTP